MGRYLIIGIATNLSIKKKDAEAVFESVQKAIEFVEDSYAPSDVYDRAEDGEYVTFSIKDKLLENELADFLYDFYTVRLSHKNDFRERDDIISKLKEAHTAENIMALAKKRCWEHFQEDSYWDPIYIKNKGWNTLYTSVKGIDLSLDGKILMECYESLFKFFTLLLKDRFNKYLISKALRVTISG